MKIRNSGSFLDAQQIQDQPTVHENAFQTKQHTNKQKPTRTGLTLEYELSWGQRLVPGVINKKIHVPGHKVIFSKVFFTNLLSPRNHGKKKNIFKSKTLRAGMEDYSISGKRDQLNKEALFLFSFFIYRCLWLG